jgi:hypothetical protein
MADMVLVVFTDVHENYGSHWKSKGGEEYVVAHLSFAETVSLGRAGLEALVHERRGHVEHDSLPSDISESGDYQELICNWEILTSSEYVTESQRLWDLYPEMRAPWEKQRPEWQDRSALTDSDRLARQERWEAQGVLSPRIGEETHAYHERARAWVAERSKAA